MLFDSLEESVRISHKIRRASIYKFTGDKFHIKRLIHNLFKICEKSIINKATTLFMDLCRYCYLNGFRFSFRIRGFNYKAAIFLRRHPSIRIEYMCYKGENFGYFRNTCLSVADILSIRVPSLFRALYSRGIMREWLWQSSNTPQNARGQHVRSNEL